MSTSRSISRLSSEAHDVSTVRAEGWEGLSNGVLLTKAAEAGFAVLVTNDKSLGFQQDLERAQLGVVVLRR